MYFEFGLKADRVKGVVAEGVKEIWLSSEDTGAYGAPLNLFFWNLFLLHVFNIV